MTEPRFYVITTSGDTYRNHGRDYQTVSYSVLDRADAHKEIGRFAAGEWPIRGFRDPAHLRLAQAQALADRLNRWQEEQERKPA